jgi:hypothetical protein
MIGQYKWCNTSDDALGAPAAFYRWPSGKGFD